MSGTRRYNAPELDSKVAQTWRTAVVKHSVKHVIEYGAVRAAAWLLQCIPYRLALAFGGGLAWMLFHVLSFRAHDAQERIRQVFGDRFSPDEVKRIAWRSWLNFVLTIVEMIRIPVSKPEWVRSIVDVGDSDKKVLAHLQTGQGAIIIVAHMGSWEMASLTSMACGVRMFSVAAAQKNKLVDEFICRMRSGMGFEVITRGASIIKGIIRRIREGKVLALLPDVRSRTPGITVRFLGSTANVAGGIGLIARLTGVPIFPCVITRLGWARHRYRVLDPIWPDKNLEKKEDWRRMTQAVFDVFDRAIREHPDQWFWFNKRWILDPLKPEESAISVSDNEL
jgi:Kdo2-lipid IVA lauroyltransferase/acyltransferase